MRREERQARAAGAHTYLKATAKGKKKKEGGKRRREGRERARRRRASRSIASARALGQRHGAAHPSLTLAPLGNALGMLLVTGNCVAHFSH